MIHHRGASLSEQQTDDLLLWQDLSLSTATQALISQIWWCIHTVEKSSQEIARYHICQQPGQLQWLHTHGLNITLKSRAQFLAFIRVPKFMHSPYLKLPTTAVPEICTAWDSLPLMIHSSTNRSKFHACFNFSRLCKAPGSSPTECTSSIFVNFNVKFTVYGRKQA